MEAVLVIVAFTVVATSAINVNAPPCSINELNCYGRCRDGGFHCGDVQKTCIASTARCDGNNDCTDGSDEVGCNGKCSNIRFHCGDVQKTCIASSARCDGNNDCTDGSDEVGCNGKCTKNRYHCGDAEPKCIPQYDRCDGYRDCKGNDHKDELNCGAECHGYAYKKQGYDAGAQLYNCTADRECARKCDGITTCTDSSDEHGCNGACWNGKFHCGQASPKCVTACNGKTECPRHIDETNCGSTCTGLAYPGGPSLVKCSNGRCARRCNGYDQCPGQADEKNCGAKCKSLDPKGPTLFNCRHFGMTPHCQGKCDGWRKCGVFTAINRRWKTVYWDQKGCNGTCHNKRVHCGSLQPKCLPPSKICNGWSDCKDARDEKGCKGKNCPNGKFHCGYRNRDFHKACMSQSRVCDGTEDCNDGIDEANCKAG